MTLQQLNMYMYKYMYIHNVYSKNNMYTLCAHTQTLEAANRKLEDGMEAMKDELKEANATISSLQQDNSSMDWVTITIVHQLNQDKMKLKMLEQAKLKAKVGWRDVWGDIHVHVHCTYMYMYLYMYMYMYMYGGGGGGLIFTLHLYIMYMYMYWGVTLKVHEYNKMY